MRIVCPTCNAAYEVSDTLLKPGRAVRCVRCNEEWVAVEIAPQPPPEPEPQQEEITDPAVPPRPQVLPEPRRAPVAERPPGRTAAPPRRGNAGLRAAWAASLVVLLLFGWGAYTWRGEVMRSWPPSTRLYDALGLNAPGR